jgi:predicted RNase H-like HicB family nuclease
MTQTYTARVWKEDDIFIAQCAEIDVASDGTTEQEALANLREALELYLEPPMATIIPKVSSIEVEVGAP